MQEQTTSNIEARCTNCRKNTDHLVLEIVDGAPKKVQCTHCNRQHAYRPPTAPRKPATRKALPIDNEREEWKRLQPNLNHRQARPYAMTEAYKVNNIVDHPNFGLGLVQRIVGPHKMRILFADGCKILRCK